MGATTTPMKIESLFLSASATSTTASPADMDEGVRSYGRIHARLIVFEIVALAGINYHNGHGIVFVVRWFRSIVRMCGEPVH